MKHYKEDVIKRRDLICVIICGVIILIAIILGMGCAHAGYTTLEWDDPLDFKKFCPVCQEEGKTSKVYPGGCQTTLAYCPGYYDEDGNFHNGGCNTTTCTYSCSNGHIFHD